MNTEHTDLYLMKSTTVSMRNNSRVGLLMEFPFYSKIFCYGNLVMNIIYILILKIRAMFLG